MQSLSLKTIVGMVLAVTGLSGLIYFAFFDTNQASITEVSQPRVERPEWMDPAEQPWTLADLGILDGDGETLDLSNHDVVVVNYWARWCGPCIAEMPSLAALNKQLQSVKGLVVAVNTLDGKPEEIAEYLKSQPTWAGLAFAYPQDPGITSKLGARGLPATVILDRSGKVVAQHFAPANWADPAILEYFKSLAVNGS